MDTPRRDDRSPVEDPGRSLVSRSCRVNDASFAAFLATYGAPRTRWTAPDGLEIAAAGTAGTITARGPDRFETVRERATTLFETVDADGPTATRPRLFGGFAFHADHESDPPWRGFPAARFVLPAVQLTRTDEETWLTVNRLDGDVAGDGGTELSPPLQADSDFDTGRTEDAERTLERARETVASLPSMRSAGEPPGVASTRQPTARADWTQMIEQAVERIGAGDLQKVTLATPLEVDLEAPLAIPDAVERLRRTYPECYRFLVQPSDGASFFGASPERLVRLDGRYVETEALAGSVARGDTPEADDAHAETLTDSEKLREEHEIVVDAISEWLTPFGSVSIGDRGLRKLTNIQHLHTPISATLDRETHVLSLVEALHPTPAVGGLPREPALTLLRDAETFDRGWYASPIGWFDAAGNGEFTVAIRSGVADGRRATLFAGNGIVADSDPDEEWAEIQPKYRPVLDELER